MSWHICQGIDGKGRQYKIIRKVKLMKPCHMLLDRCYILEDGRHVRIENLFEKNPNESENK
jgi:hypothetical protein